VKAATTSGLSTGCTSTDAACSQLNANGSGGTIFVNTDQKTNLNQLSNASAAALFAHEFGHFFGLADVGTNVNGCTTQTDSVMWKPTNISATMACLPTPCDDNRTSSNYNPGDVGGNTCPDGNCELCDTGGSGGNCGSPIIIDLKGSDFPLSSLRNGVRFDLDADGSIEKTSWTAAGSKLAFLALDRNGNGSIDNGAELFGNYTPQPPSSYPNGFLALAEYDKAGNGGNENGIIDPADSIFTSLKLWIDSNHDGISQPGELHTLSEFAITSISLSYNIAYRKDEYGNQFRYRARVQSTDRSVSRWAYDVFFVTNDSGSAATRGHDDALEALWSRPLLAMK
jgi:hypothetical protein